MLSDEELDLRLRSYLQFEQWQIDELSYHEKVDILRNYLGDSHTPPGEILRRVRGRRNLEE